MSYLDKKVLITLDTNILVDFFLIYLKEEREQDIPPSLKKTKLLLEFYESKRFINLASCWSIWELREVVQTIRLQEKYILSGYTPREFNDAKREINLNIDEIRKINQAVSDLSKPSIKLTQLLEEKDIGLIELLNQLGFQFKDVILIIQTEKNKCEYFITRDQQLKESEVLQSHFKVKIIGVKEFLNLLN